MAALAKTCISLAAAALLMLGAKCVLRKLQRETSEHLFLSSVSLFQFSNDGPNGESMCLQGPDCFMVSFAGYSESHKNYWNYCGVGFSRLWPVLPLDRSDVQPLPGSVPRKKLIRNSLF